MSITPEYKIGIIGCGKMGRDLFDFLTGFPFKLFLVCKDDNSCFTLKNTFEKKQNRALKYGLTEKDFFSFREQNTLFTTTLNSLKDCGLVIECISESIQKKTALFKDLSSIVNKNCIVTSNSSSISPDILFSDLPNKKYCLGLHFFYPVSMKKIIEINLPQGYSQSTIKTVTKFLERIKKRYLILKDENHFMMNRIFLKLQAGCCHFLYDEDLGVNEIDELIKAHLFPVGVFEFFKQVGYKVMLESVKNYLSYEQEPQFYQPLIYYLERKIYEGELGIRIKPGRYEPSIDEPVVQQVAVKDRLDLLDSINNWYLDSVFEVLQRRIATKDEIASFVMDYMMVDKSPFELAEEIGYTPK